MHETTPRKISLTLVTWLALAGVLLFTTITARAQSRAEYRAFWVDTFNTPLNQPDDVTAVANRAKAAKANAIFAQVRRRGDAWYLNSLEPPPDFTPILSGFDPLADLIYKAHKEGIEVHAFVIIGAVWNKNPTFAPSATLGPPTNPAHIFNLHGGYDPVTKKIIPGPNNWLTRTLLPDGTGGIGFQGHRFGSDFWIDLGHPDAAAHTVEVLMHLVRNYAIDGLHLDRIRYPEISLSGQTPSTGTNIGYNATSVARFQQHYGIASTAPPPAINDPLWSQWRRDQVTNFVRRLYLNAIAVKPELKLSGAFIAFGGGPASEAAWNSAEAYWRVYQDWRAWTEEGITDIAMPMNYKREHIAAQESQFNAWAEWTKNHQYNRSSMIGLGVFLNSIEGTIRQTRRSLAPSALGNSAKGVIFFSMANSNTYSNTGSPASNPTSIANPYSVPPNQNTPTRSFGEFASGLTTGKSIDGMTLYENTADNPTAIFADEATLPVLPWKTAPTLGHIMGYAKRADTSVLDTANVTIENIDSHLVRSTKSDGGGFYGGVDLAPGRYLVKAQLGDETLYSCLTEVSAGGVAKANPGVEISPPTTTAMATPAAPDGANNWYQTDVTIDFDAVDTCSGVAYTEYSVDEGASWLAVGAGPLTINQEGTTVILYRSTDRAGNAETAQSLTIKLDKTAPALQVSATPTSIKGNNDKPVTIMLTAEGTDAVSGLTNVSYVVTDEYGTPLAIPSRPLAGQSAAWTETLEVKARRHGNDFDGRLYRIVATLTDEAGHTTSVTIDVRVAHDQRG